MSTGIGNLIAAPFTAGLSLAVPTIGGSNVLGGGKTGFLGSVKQQQQQSASSLQQQAFAQFPELQKAIAQFGFENVQSLANPLSERINAPIPTVGASGLYPEQEQSFRTAVQQALGAFSGQYARQGMLNPQHVDAIAGAAAQAVAPQFAQMIGQQLVAPEQITQNRINQLLSLISTYPGLLGGQATQVSQGQTNFPGLIQSMLPGFAQGVGSQFGGKI